MAEPWERGDGPDAAEVRLNRLFNLILESAVEALGFDAATVSARHGDDVATLAATDQRVVALTMLSMSPARDRVWRCSTHTRRSPG
jgi:hypothetical protein